MDRRRQILSLVFVALSLFLAAKYLLVRPRVTSYYDSIVWIMRMLGFTIRR